MNETCIFGTSQLACQLDKNLPGVIGGEVDLDHSLPLMTSENISSSQPFFRPSKLRNNPSLGVGSSG